MDRISSFVLSDGVKYLYALIQRHRLKSGFLRVFRNQLVLVSMNGGGALVVLFRVDDDESALGIVAGFDHRTTQQVLAPKLLQGGVAQARCIRGAIYPYGS